MKKEYFECVETLGEHTGTGTKPEIEPNKYRLAEMPINTREVTLLREMAICRDDLKFLKLPGLSGDHKTGDPRGRQGLDFLVVWEKQRGHPYFEDLKRNSGTS
jgi:hypothetical protein